MLYIPSDATDFATTMVKGMPFADVRVRVADSVAKMIWMAAPWRWTVGSVDPNITLVNGQSDYAFTKPSDFLYLEKSYLWDSVKYTPLKIESHIPTTSGIAGVPSRIAFIATLDKLRVDPAPQLGSGTNVLVNLYKKTYTPITTSNISTAGVLAMPDEWTWVFETGILAAAWEFSDDDRAGTCTTTSDGKFQYTGQWARFWAGIQEMRNCEKLLLQWPGLDQQKG